MTRSTSPSCRVRRIIEETILHYDPDRAVADEQAALAARHVTLDHDTTGPATTEVHMLLDTLDALHLDDTLADLATGLRRLGDTDPLEVRRAKAVGVLADPQRALDLLTTGELTERTGGGRVELYLHLDATDLTADPARGGGGEIERLGAATRGAARRLAGPARPGRDHRPPGPGPARPRRPWTGTTRRPGCGTPPCLADATCVFPGCTRDSRRCDLDHIDGLRPARGRRTAGADPAGQPGTPVPHPPPAQDPRPLELPAPRPTTTTGGPPRPATTSPSTPAAAPDADDPERPTPASTPSRRATGMPAPDPIVVSTSSTTEVCQRDVVVSTGSTTGVRLARIHHHRARLPAPPAEGHRDPLGRLSA